MGIAESHTFSRQPIESWRRNSRLGIVTAHIAVTEVVGQDRHDVRPLGAVQAAYITSEMANQSQKQPDVPPGNARAARIWQFPLTTGRTNVQDRGSCW